MSRKSTPYQRHRVEEARRRARLAADRAARLERQRLEDLTAAHLEEPELDEVRP